MIYEALVRYKGHGGGWRCRQFLAGATIGKLVLRYPFERQEAIVAIVKCLQVLAQY